jgi:magnesium chelatase family protein
MHNATTVTRANLGMQAPEVRVEVHMRGGIPGFSIVGLPETAVKESKDRVRAALLNAGFEIRPRKVTVNLAPADLRKEGGRFDLPIAIGILAASNQIPKQAIDEYEFAGELSLTGELRPVKGILPFALATKKSGKKLICPCANQAEAALSGADILVAEHLLAVTAHLKNIEPLAKAEKIAPQAYTETLDIADIHGQMMAKRALTVAAAGGHSMLMSGPPGTGKSMLAQRLPTLLPALNEQQAQEVAGLYSISSEGFKAENWARRPFRSPHHTTSNVALVGGGGEPKPGEISLAHHGVLFLDELPEFSRKVIECLREPIETGEVNIARAAQSVRFPARFQLVCAMNPCPCGYLTDKALDCRCTPQRIEQYINKISGPMLDRIDLQIEVPKVNISELMQGQKQATETSAQLREKVTALHAKQYAEQGCLNANLSTTQMQDLPIDKNTQTYFYNAAEKLGLSLRSYHRILKVAKTIAELDGIKYVKNDHMYEALFYRKIEQNKL